ncbi:MAG: hypothetical protein ABI321_01390 [Polyangia bacterium]
MSSSADAEAAYLGLDAHIDKAITLGFAGFNSANSANIAPQTTTGTVTGTLTVTGQVDQGNSSNKTMNLVEALAMYSDDAKVTYDTDPAALPLLGLSLKGIPTGTLSGSLDGDYKMTGNLEGTVTLALTFAGALQAGAGSTVERKPGTTNITGTATSKYGTYAVSLTR